MKNKHLILKSFGKVRNNEKLKIMHAYIFNQRGGKMIIVNAILPVKEEKIEDAIKQAETLINESRTHDGNISYNLYQDVLDKSLVFIEKWESEDALKAHMQTPVFIEFGEIIKEYLTGELDIKLIAGEEIN